MILRLPEIGRLCRSISLYLLKLVLICGVWTVCSHSLFSAEVGHYIPGLAGLKSSVTPPQGFYFANTTLAYTFGRINDPEGKPTTLDGDINIIGNVSSFLYMTNATPFGARYGVQVNIPVTNRAYLLDPSALDQVGKTGLGDIYIQPLALGWSGPNNHITVRYGFFVPTGRFRSNGLDNTGKGFWTHMFTVGDTYFFGDSKVWNVSGMFRYETHTKKEGVDVTAGDNAVFEWGFGRKLGEKFDVGMTGASTWQVTDEQGSLSAPNKYSAHAIGGEVQYAIPQARMSLRFRANFDVAAYDRAQGFLLVFGLVWRP